MPILKLCDLLFWYYQKHQYQHYVQGIELKVAEANPYLGQGHLQSRGKFVEAQPGKSLALESPDEKHKQSQTSPKGG